MSAPVADQIQNRRLYGETEESEIAPVDKGNILL